MSAARHDVYREFGDPQAKALARRSTLPKGGRIQTATGRIAAVSLTEPASEPRHRQSAAHPHLPHHPLRLHREPVGCLSAHVTSSDWEVHTPTIWKGTPAKPENRPEVLEVREKGKNIDNHPVYDERPLRGEDVVKLQTVPWAGEFDKDNTSEGGPARRGFSTSWSPRSRKSPVRSIRRRFTFMSGRVGR